MPADNLEPLRLSWLARPSSDNDLAELLKEFKALKSEVAKIDNLERSVKALETKADKMERSLEALADPVALCCLMDTFFNVRGLADQKRSRQTWIKENKQQLSLASRIPECRIEKFLQKYRGLGDESAHIVKSDDIAEAIDRLTNDNDRSDFKSLFQSLLNHSVADELGGKFIFVTTLDGRRETAPEDRLMTTLKPST